MRKSFVCILVVLVMGVLLAVLDPLPSAAKAEIRGILNQASQLEAVGLDPQRMSGDDPALFNGYRPLDQRNLSPEEQRQTVNALNTDFRYRVWEVARSFKPRQALILTTAQGKYRLLLSYECSQMKLVRPDGSQGPLVPLGGSSAGQLQRICPSHAPSH